MRVAIYTRTCTDTRAVRARTIAFSLLATIPVGVLGCVTPVTPPPPYFVQVDSISAPDEPPRMKYVLFPGREGIAASDLLFREFAHYVDRALQRRGFEQAASAEEAEVAILLNYGIGEPKTTAYTYSLPIYGQTGGGMATYSGSTLGPGGLSSTEGTIYQQPTYGVVGSETQTGLITRYSRYLILDAVDLEAYRKTQAIVPLWKTTVTSTGSSADLRLVFPVRVGASSEYIAKNTGQQVSEILQPSDPRVLYVKGELSDLPPPVTSGKPRTTMDGGRR
jgi:hypothetical protein